MVIFRWIVGVFGALCLVGAVGSFLIYVSFSLDHWLVRARKFGHWLWLTFGLWFNVEVWGSVIRTIIHWNH